MYNMKSLAMLAFLLFGCAYSAVVTFDKEFFSQSFSDSDVAGWSIGGTAPPTSNLEYTCAGERLFGGYGLFTGDPTSQPTFITRTWTGLPAHWSVRVRAKIYKIDSWTGESLIVTVDGSAVGSYSWSATFGGSDTCGTASPSSVTVYNDGYVLLDHNMSHTASTLTIQFSSDLWVRGSAYWGIREFQLDLDGCLPNCGSCNTSTDCLGCSTALNMQAPTPAGGGYSNCNCMGGYKTEITSNCMAATCMQCVSACSVGYYLNGAVCSPCATGCAACTGPTLSVTDCQTCSLIGVYSSAAVPANVCPSCDPSCYKCTGSLATQCSACTGGLLLFANTCLASCPPNYYGKQLLGQCLTCSANCATCFGGLSTQCTSCTTNFYLSAFQCVGTCPSNYYGYLGVCYFTCPLTTFGSGSLCQPCVSNCDNCSNAAVCSFCTSGFGMSAGLCVSPCPAGNYLQNTNRTCITCDSTCFSCSGSSPTSCTSCLAGLALMADGTCTSGCLPGTYLNGVTGTCSSCDPSCATCFGGTANTCKSCSSPLYLDINNTMCLTSCNALYQAIDNTAMACWTCEAGLAPNQDQCIKCFNSCLTCVGDRFDQCTACPSGRTLTFQMCVCSQGTYEQSGQCIDTNKTPILGTMIWMCLLANLFLCLLLELLFKHPTNLTQTLQLFQMSSFSYYLSTMYPYEMDATFLHMVKTHIALLIPPLYLPNDIVAKSAGKFAQTGLYGVMVFDGQGVLIGYALLMVLALIPKLVKAIVDPMRNRSIFNACCWMLDKLSMLSLLWFRFTVMVLFASAILTFQDFTWSNLYDLASLGFFVLLIGLIITLICVKKWDEDSKTYQFLLVYNTSYDYKQKKSEDSEENKPVATTQPLTEANETKQNLKPQGHHDMVSSTISISPVNNTTQRKFSFPAKAADDEKMAHPDQQEQLSDVSDIIERDSQYKPMQVGPLLQPIISIVLGIVVPVLKNYPSLQAIIYTAGVAMIASNGLSQKWRRKITKLNSTVVVVSLMIQSMLLMMLTAQGMVSMGIGLMAVWALSAIVFLLITILQLIVNLQLLPRIITSIPLRLYNVLHAQPKLK